MKQDLSYIGLYFGAFYHPGSLAFTRDYLTTFYYEANNCSKKVELLYVNFDRSFIDFSHHTLLMPFLSLPFQNPQSSPLKKLLNVTNIPLLVFFEVQKPNDGGTPLSEIDDFYANPLEVTSSKRLELASGDGYEIVMKHGRKALGVLDSICEKRKEQARAE